MSLDEAPPATPPLEAYTRRADELLAAFRAGEESARARFKWGHPRFVGRPFSALDGVTLDAADARLVLARESAFDGWDELAGFAQAMAGDGPVARFERAADAVVAGDIPALRAMLAADPALVHDRATRRHHATLLHYVAANGVESSRQRTPPNAVEVATLLLDAGADVDALSDAYDQKCTTLSLLVSSSHPAEAGLQAELATLLVDGGAALVGPGSAWRSAVVTALTFGFTDTARALVEHGAPASDLPTAAGLGRIEGVATLLPAAPPDERRRAFALATQHGHAEVVRALLDAGEDPSRHNPEGHHAHTTPLHMAVMNGHADTVRLLVTRGARLDVRDALWESTPLEWAEYFGREEIAEYLRAAGSPG